MSLASSGGQKGVSASVDIDVESTPRETQNGRKTSRAPYGTAAQDVSGGATPLAQHPSAFPFREAAPHSVLLAGVEGELQTGLLDGAHAADRLRFLGEAVVVGGGIEDDGVAALTQADRSPFHSGGPNRCLGPTPFQHRAHDDSISPRWHRQKLIRGLFPIASPAMPRMSKFVHPKLVTTIRLR